MRMYDVIKKKRDGGELTDVEIARFITGYIAGEIPDYQVSALLMAIWFRGMSARETFALTQSICRSGASLSLPQIDSLRVDKHSTGGVGDKTSLVVAPAVAALGVPIAKMSGRGLGHTGGTVDKLEAIRGFRTDLSQEEFAQAVARHGIAIVGQSATLAPADKLLYALRDVTATVDSLPLIASSIMGKKLAANDDCIVLDVKLGSGAFLKSEEEGRALAQMMIDLGRRAGKRMCALLTDMDAPLGYAIGNSLEVIEAIETLQGRGPRDLCELSVALAAQMLRLVGHGTLADCERDVRRVLASGEALEKFADMVRGQGGDTAWVYDTAHFPTATHTKVLAVTTDGYLSRLDAELCGRASLLLGAGRSRKEDEIDMTAGIRLAKKPGDAVRAGEPVATLYTTRCPHAMQAAEDLFFQAVTVSAEPPSPRPLIFDVLE